MFPLLLLIVGLISTQKGHSQTPFDVLRKAEHSYCNGKLDQALLQIDRAEQMSYCTCGSCLEERNKKANLLRYQIYSSLEQHLAARQALEQIDFSYTNNQVDSLKILSYQAEFGKELLAEKIDTALEHIAILCVDEICFAELSLTNEALLRFQLPFVMNHSYLIARTELDGQEVIQRWCTYFKKSSLYPLLQQKN